MKKFSLFAALALVVIASIALLTWTNRENILTHFFSRHLHVPVSLGALSIDRKGVTMERFWVGTPPHSQSSTSFAAETANLHISSSAIFSNPVVIDELTIDHVFVGIEFYDAEGTESNWTTILQEDSPKRGSRSYLIKDLIFRDLTVEVRKADGGIKRYPLISEMEFHNVSSTSEFPIDEIEKTIFQLMIKNLFQRLSIDQLFKNIITPLNLPSQTYANHLD